MITAFVLLILAAYLLGSVPSAYLAARWSRGIDIRKYGSGNVGASNLRRLVPIWVFILATIFDLGKGAVVVWAAQLVGLSITQQVTVGVAAIVGHNWPAFLHFSGGRGGLTLLGVTLILEPALTSILLAIVLIFGIFRQLALGTILAVTLLPICTWLFSQPMGITEEPLPLSLGFLAIFLITVVRRLTVPRAAIAASVSTRELLVNRLLFDRDIRDREAWVSQTPAEVSPDKQSAGQQEEQRKR